MRFAIDVGSFEEDDDERGYAHLVEHLAFRTTRSAPNGGIDRRFAALGAAFGRDQNGSTTLDATTFKLDFANASDAAAAAAFTWARDVADGLVLTDSGVAAERGVVLAEQEARDTPAHQAGLMIARFQLPESRSVRREPGGGQSALANATPETIRHFYKRWYRPENAILVVVSDRPLEEIEARVVASFSDWRPAGSLPVRASLTPPDPHRRGDALQLTVPTLPTAVSSCRFRPPEPRGDERLRLRSEVSDGLWSGALNNRYKAIVGAGGSGLLGASVGFDNSQREYASVCLTVVPINDGWEKALAVAQGEFRRFATGGMTEKELQEQIEDHRGALRGAIMEEAAQTSDVLADAILKRALDHRPIVSPREALHAFDVAVEGIDPEAMKTRFAASWSGAGPLLTLLTPTVAPPRAVSTVWHQNEAATALARFNDQKRSTWAYPTNATPGVIVSREEIADPGFTRVRFANGLILNFKHRDAETNKVTLVARFGHGRADVRDADLLGSMLGVELFAEGGLGKMSAQEITASLAPIDWRFKFGLSPTAFHWTDHTLAANVETKLRVFAAFFADPGFRPALDDRIAPAIDVMYRAYASQPEMTLSAALGHALDPDDPENLPPRDTLVALKSADFARVLGPVVRDAPIELTIVGDMTQPVAERLVAGTLGALAPRRPSGAPTSQPRYFRFPDHPVPTIRAVHQGPADRALAELVWPLYVARPERRREERALGLVAAIFRQLLRDRVRVALGKAYSPEVSTEMPDYGDQGSLVAILESNPTQIDTLIAEAAAVGQTIAAGTFDQAALDTARRPMLDNLAAEGASNRWWAAALSGSSTDPAIPADVMGTAAMIAGIMLDEVKDAARRWLTKPPFVVVAAPGAPPPAAPAPAGVRPARKAG